MTDTQTSNAIFEPGQRFGRYKITRRIGIGGMGEVYEGLHVELKKRVALKTLLPNLAELDEIRARFLQEGEAAARIRHPHIVDIYDVGTEGKITYLVMEFLEGNDLSRLLKDEKILSPRRVADIMLPVLSAVSAAHDEGILHRDLKPGNIFLTMTKRGVQPKVLDFGISKLMDDKKAQGLTSSGALLGTPQYMSPEQAHGGGNLDARSDQYALGVILYQALTGTRPFPQTESMYQVLHKIVQGEFAPPSSAKPDLPQPVNDLVMRAMATRPDDRFPSLRELGFALLPFASRRTQALWEPVFDPAASHDIPGADSDTAPIEALRPSNAPVVTHTPSGIAAPSAAAFQEPSVPSHTWAQQADATGSGVHPPSWPMSKIAVAGLLFVLAVGLFGFAFSMLGADDAEVVETAKQSTFEVALTVTPPDAAIELDGKSMGTGHMQWQLRRDGRTHRLRVTKAGYEPVTVSFVDTPPPKTIQLQALPKPPPVESDPQAAAEKPVAKKPVTKPRRKRTQPVVKKPPTASAGTAKKAPVKKAPVKKTAVKTKQKRKVGANEAPILR